MKETIAFFPGSFNPFTIGHASIVKRGLAIFSKIIIGVGVNVQKLSAEDIEKRLAAIKAVYASEPRVEVKAYHGLTAEEACKMGADVILRGVRNAIDFQYEQSIAELNREINGMETILLFAMPSECAVSSSAVRELEAFGYDVSRFLPSRKD
jgi:pantetheine-phosphate adenylyltransferase